MAEDIKLQIAARAEERAELCTPYCDEPCSAPCEQQYRQQYRCVECGVPCDESEFCHRHLQPEGD